MLFLEKTSSEVYQNYRKRFLDSKEVVPTEHIDTFDNSNLIYSSDFPVSLIVDGHSYCIIRTLENDDTQIIGFMLYSHISRSYYRRSKLIDIYLLEGNRGKGFGRQSVEILLQEAQKFGSLFLSLFVANSNLPARSLYLKLGFTDWKEFQRGKYMLFMFKDADLPPTLQ